MDSIDPTFRFLGPHEGSLLSEAIEAAYGDTYDVRWVYDSGAVSARLAAGTYVSCIAESGGGEFLCHEGMALTSPTDSVGHSGQAVTMPLARGMHIFTQTKRHLMESARSKGMAGMYSEATAAHPYSQRANLELGAHETGFLLGWIPASVSNDAATEPGQRRCSAALFYSKLNDGQERFVYAPPRHREIVGRTLDLCQLRGRLAEPSGAAQLKPHSILEAHIDPDHNLALLTVHLPGADLHEAIGVRRHHLFHRLGLDAIYVDLPLQLPETALVADHLERLGVSYAGIFPNPLCDGDVLRMQTLHRVRIAADDVAVASEHGRTLLDYVLADLPKGALSS